MNSPRFLSQAWEQRILHSRNPYTSLWREVSRYAGGNAADRVLNSLGADARNIQAFMRSVALADEYWVSYEDSSNVIDSVPLYYGALSLGNAIVAATMSSSHMTSRTSGHGLKVVPDFTKRDAVLNCRIAFGGSLDSFGFINDALGGDPLSGLDCKFIDLLTLLPELSGRLEHFALSLVTEVTLSPAKRWHDSAAATADSGSMIAARFRPLDLVKLNLGYVRDKLAISAYLSEVGATVADGQLYWSTKRSPPTEIDNLTISARGARWFLPKMHGKLIPEYCIYLAALHTLSVFARYLPTYWLKIQEELCDEWVLIRDFIAVAEEKVPRLAINHFAKASHRFESSSDDF